VANPTVGTPFRYDMPFPTGPVTNPDCDWGFPPLRRW